jgi:hypothetical protein
MLARSGALPQDADWAQEVKWHAIRDEDIERLSPLGHEHITLTGRYRIVLPDPLRDRAAYRPIKAPPPDAAAA